MADDPWAGFEAVEIGKPRSVDAPTPLGWSQFEEVGPQKAALAAKADKSSAEPIGVGDIVRATARGVPIIGGLPDKLNAATYAALSPILPGDDTVSQAPSFGERYSDNLTREKARDTKFATEHPVANIGAELAGGTATMIPAATTAIGAKLLGLTAKTLPGQIVAGGASGAAIGAADAAVRGDSIVHGGEVGLGVGAVSPIAGRAVGKIVQGIRDTVAPRPVSATGEFGVPLSKGQQAGDFDTIMTEQAALRGGMGQRAQQVAQDFFDKQKAATENARSGIGADLAGGRTVADSPQTAAELVSEAVGNKAAQARTGYKGLYDEFAAKPGTIERSAFDKIGDSIKNRLSLRDEPVIIDDRTTPFASQALRDVEQQVGQTRYQNRAATDAMRTETFPPNQIDGVGLGDLDQARKRLIRFYQDAKSSRNDADIRATRNVITSFDDHIEHAINAGLFTGDETALATLKAARSAYSDYRKTFAPQGPGDEAGRIVQQILGRYDGQAATPTQISNWLYGASGIGNTGTSVKVAQRVRSIVGADAPEWNGVRQGLWEKLTGATEGRTDWGPQKISERVYEFLNGGGKPLSQVLFTGEEIQRMQQYAGLLKQMVPPVGSVNTSNTAPVLAKLAQQSLTGITAMLGFHAGGPIGGLAGYAANAARRGMQERSAANRVSGLLYGSPERDAIVRAAMRRSDRTGGGVGLAAIPAFGSLAPAVQ